MTRTALLLLGVFGAAACSGPGLRPGAQASGPVSPQASAAKPLSIRDLPDIDIASVLAHTRTLSSDEFEGRGPGTPGEALTVGYLVDQFKTMGLRPGGADGTYVQKVPLVGITAAPTSLIFRKGETVQRLKWKDDVVAWTKRVVQTSSLDGSELVFVGYGTTAPEYDWDDYKGVDVRGKTLVMLINDPPVPSGPNPSELDPKIFGGRAMTYYGRWTYKYEMGALKGAASVLIVHETEAAGYAFDVVQSKVAEQLDLMPSDRNMGRPAIEGWITIDRARRLFEMAGHDFDTLKTQAARRDFRPVPLGVTASMKLHNQVRAFDSRNVIATLEGSDPFLKNECVVYTAHWDHLGISGAAGLSEIYHGARDNAVGTGGLLEVARALTRLPVRPARSIVFVAVTAEEHGLLGSRHYARVPVYPLARTLANINIDGLNVHGRTKDLALVGYGASELDEYVREAAREQGRIVLPDRAPDTGSAYRSDHFSFAAAGVPALNSDGGTDYVARPTDFGHAVRGRYIRRDYHKPTDVVTPDWDLNGAREDLQVLLAVGYRVAQANQYPAWKPGNPYRATRGP